MSKKLIEAVKAGDLNKVKRHLFEGADVNFGDPKTGETLIGTAISNRHRDIFELLLSYGAEIEAETDDARSALIWACKEGRADDVESLLKAGTGPNFHTLWGNVGDTPLIVAAEHGNRRIVELLLRYGAQINTVALSANSTALVAAVSSGDLELVRFLVEQGADVDEADQGASPTPLMMACINDNYDAAEVLLKAGADPDLEREFFGTALHLAAFRGHLELIKLLRSFGADIRAKCDDGKTVLISAAKAGHAEALKLIMHELENEPLTEPRGDDPVLDSLRQEIEKLWIDDGDNDERNAIHWAAIYGHLAAVRILSENGASIDGYDKGGRSPLRYACMRGHKKVAKYLVKSGALFGDFACAVDHPLAKRDSIAMDDMSLRLSQLKRAFDEPDEFMWSCFWGHHDLAQLFLKKGANANSWDSQGRTPLMLASGASSLIYDSIWSYEAKYDVRPDRRGRARIVQLLISNKADLNAVDSYGMTALMWASSRGLANVVEMLLIAAADPEITDKRGNTALDWATVEGRVDVVKLLKSPRRKSARPTEQNALDSEQESISAPKEDSLKGNEGPFFLLFHYRLLESQLSCVELYGGQLRLAESILAFLACVAAAHVKSCSDAPAVKKSASAVKKRDLWQGGISPGTWRDISEKCLPSLREIEGSPLASALCSLWTRGKRKRKTQFREVMDWLIERKNDAKHDRGPRTEEQCKPFCRPVEEKLSICRRDISFLNQFPVRRVVEQDLCAETGMMVMKTVCYSGDHPALPLETVNYPKPLVLNRLYMETSPQHWIPLYPFVSANYCNRCEQLETFFVDRWRGPGKKALLKSFEHGHSIESVEVGRELERWARLK